jgi:hypothetical protein
MDVLSRKRNVGDEGRRQKEALNGGFLGRQKRESNIAVPLYLCLSAHLQRTPNTTPTSRNVGHPKKKKRKKEKKKKKK